jgi:phosphoribosylamine--glycine ligase
VLPRLRSDLLQLCLAAREPGGLAGTPAEFADDWAVTLVLASAGYPASSSKGDVISGLDDATALEGVEVTHAGTARRDGEVVTAGGRVLNVTGLGPNPADARRRAYDAAERISFDGKQMRTDIAERAVERAAAA